METVIWVVGTIFGYGLVAGVTHAIAKFLKWDEVISVLVPIFWPLGLPFALAWMVGQRLTEFGTDYLEAQKEKRQEKRYRIAREAREREEEIQREIAKLDAEEEERQASHDSHRSARILP